MHYCLQWCFTCCDSLHFKTVMSAASCVHFVPLVEWLQTTFDFVNDMRQTRRNTSRTFRHQLPVFQVDLCPSSCGNLIVPQTCRQIGDRAFSVTAPCAWNRLPTELKLLWSTDSFRRDLKTFPFDSVYGAPGYGSTLWCTVNLLVGSAIQVPQLQSQYYSQVYGLCSVVTRILVWALIFSEFGMTL